jgi:hypothetical protein
VRKQPTFGAVYGLYGDGAETPTYTNEVGGQLWMYRRGQRIRFFDRSGSQVGPEHPSAVPATIWAFAHGWCNQNSPAWLNDGRNEAASV